MTSRNKTLFTYLFKVFFRWSANLQENMWMLRNNALTTVHWCLYLFQNLPIYQTQILIIQKKHKEPEQLCIDHHKNIYIAT